MHLARSIAPTRSSRPVAGRRAVPVVTVLLLVLTAVPLPAPLARLASLGPDVATAAAAIKMPFLAGQDWVIGQGYNTAPPNGTHYNCNPTTLMDQPTGTQSCRAHYQYRWSFDLARADGNTAGQTVLSPVNGTIRWMDPAFGGMSIDLGNGYAFAYFHTTLAAGLAAGQAVRQGQYLGTVSPPGGGGNGGWPHIHVSLWQTTDGGNWSRNAVPFTGGFALDGYDFPNQGDGVRDQYRNRPITSTNTATTLGSPPAIPTLQSPTNGQYYAAPGATATLRWNAVNGANEYQVLFDGVASAWQSGTSWNTPAMAAGQHGWQVRARNGSGTSGYSTKWFLWVATDGQSPTPTPAPTQTPLPTPAAGSLGITVNPTTVSVGATIGVTGTGFGANERVRLHWDSTSTTALAEPTANGSGSITAQIKVPDTVRGNHTLIARGATSGRQTTRTVAVSPSLARNPINGTPGTAVDVTVRGFGPSEQVRLNWDSATGTVLATASTNALGTGTVRIKIPESSNRWHDYTGVGLTSGVRAWGAIGVDPLFAVSPASGAGGATVSAAVKGFAASTSVTIAWNKTAGSAGTTVCRGTTNASGSYTCSFALPTGAGSFPVVATAANGTTRTVTVGVTGAAAVSTSPTQGSVGSDLAITAGGFGGGETVELSWDGGPPWLGRATDGNGAVSFRTTVPNLGTGEHTLRARGLTSGRAASVAFTVTQVTDGGGSIGNGTYRITATRQGMVGGVTSSGYTIPANSNHVSLPGCTQRSCPWLQSGAVDVRWGTQTLCGTNCYVRITNPLTNKCIVSPVEDNGPWFNLDDWWKPTAERRLNNLPTTVNILAQGYTGVDAAWNGLDVGYGIASNGKGNTNKGYPPGNRAAIDIGDGAWNAIGLDWNAGIINGVVVTMLWQSGEDRTAAAAACGSGGATPTRTPTRTATAIATATATRTPTPSATAGLTLSVASGGPGTTLTATGTGFTPGESVSLFWDATSGSALKTATANTSGGVSIVTVVPNSPRGSHTLIARGGSGRQASAGFTVLPALARNPTAGVVGASISVTAKGFAANESVKLTWDSTTGPLLGTATTDATGTGTLRITIPAGAANWHNYTGLGLTSGARAWGAIQVLPSVTLSPTSGNAGATVTATLKGFPASQSATVYWNRTGGTGGIAVCTASIAATGGATCSFTVPTTAVSGTAYPIVAVAGTWNAQANFTAGGSIAATSLVASPTSGRVATNVRLTAGGFAAGETVSASWDASTVVIGRGVASSVGTVSFNTTVPVGVAGTHTIKVRGAASGRNAQTAFAVVPGITASPLSVATGATITVTGRGFDAGSTVGVYWNRVDGTGGVRKCLVGATTLGSFSCAFAAPTGTAGTAYPIVAVSGSRSAEATVTLTSATLAAQSMFEPSADMLARQALPTATPTAAATAQPAATLTPTAPVATPENTPPSSPAPATATAIPTGTGVARPAETATLAPTIEPTATGTPTAERRRRTPTPTPPSQPFATATPSPSRSASPTPSLMPTPLATASPSPTFQPTVTPTITPTVIPTVIPTLTPTVVPTATSLPEPTATPVPITREVVLVPVADTSVDPTTPDQPQAPASIGSLTAGGPTAASSYVTYTLDGIVPGTVVDARLTYTSLGAVGAAGGSLAVLPGIAVDESGLTAATAPALGVPVAALAGDGSPVALPWTEPWVESSVDVTGTANAGGTMTFLLTGSPDAPLTIGSRESATPPRLIVTVVEG
ncbi:MAG: hypothetical protein AVDCRST_MAG73-4240 [uncultured Thermomicrobiales bacterium]|uniref:Uncharacterized protein n=1 Tax=uncultured Thermomicrobiales bacterium TaxID=1645740 RepID=A0A6J4V2H0_9BACT|nr:MAG: hypothetical protein AVDCRST_MAG73-4240 [uncultured Thermomicrobiales bacterium]